MVTGDYQTNILVQGYPGKAVCHGSLGWSTVALLRGHGRVALIDVGSFNVRKLIVDQLAALDLRPDDVTDVLISHAHWDHMVNWTMFKNARIAIGAQELDWSLTAPWGVTPVPELYVERLAAWSRLDRLHSGDEVLPGVRAEAAPGHTPGHLIYVLNGPAHDVIFTGDAAKNRSELLTRTGYQTGDVTKARETLDAIWSLWRERAESVVVPGHDMPMVLDASHESGVRYIARREAAIDAWLDESLEQITTYRLFDQQLSTDGL
jgi:N-acyl homoserine lactone hydrolase